MIWIIFLAIAMGFSVGYMWFPLDIKETLDVILMNALNIMVVIAGIEIGSQRHLVKKMLSFKAIGLIVSVPLGTIVGSLLGGSLVGFLLGMNHYDAILVSAGLGWYSLSSVVIATSYSTEVGTIAFITNVLREILSFVLIPFLARFTQLPCVAIGGATTMDSTLPVILKATNMQVGIVAFLNGLTLTLVVPILLQYLL